MRVKPAIELSIVCRKVRFATRGLTGALGEVLRMMGVKEGVWNIVLVGDEDMKELHQRHLGIGTTTDVLTFDMGEEMPSAECGMRNQVELESVICLDEARRRAGEMGHSVGDEVLLYAVHSLLHVMGYDDVTAAGARHMHAREDEILSAVGVGAVFGGKLKTRNSKHQTASRLRKGRTLHGRAVSEVGR